MSVIKFPIKDAALDPNVVLKSAIDQYESMLIMGYDEDGVLDIRSSSNIDHKEVLWMIEAFKNKLLNGDYRPE